MKMIKFVLLMYTLIIVPPLCLSGPKLEIGELSKKCFFMITPNSILEFEINHLNLFFLIVEVFVENETCKNYEKRMKDFSK